MATGAPALLGETRRLLVFEVGDFHCALPVSVVKELVPMATLSRPPGLPAILEGVLNVRGEAVPVVRMDRLFGLAERAPGLYTPLVLVRQEGATLALLVDRVTEIAEVSAGELVPMERSQACHPCVEAQLSASGGHAHLLSLERLLLEREQSFLESLRAVEQRRLSALGDAETAVTPDAERTPASASATAPEREAEGPAAVEPDASEADAE